MSLYAIGSGREYLVDASKGSELTGDRCKCMKFLEKSAAVRWLERMQRRWSSHVGLRVVEAPEVKRVRAEIKQSTEVAAAEHAVTGG